MEYIISHYPEKRRFEIKQSGLTAYVQYRLVDDSLDIIHTIVPPPLEGKGLAASLVKATYDYAQSNRLRPRATCSYAVTWLKRHPEYTDIIE